MKISKLLNKKNLSIVIFSLISLSSFAEDKPVDIWNLEKQESETISKKIYQLKINKRYLKAVFIKCNQIKMKTL
jgi:hypothetical protein